MTSVRLGDLIKVHHGWAFPGSGFGTDPELPQLVTPGNFEPGGGFVRKVKSFSGAFPSSFVLDPGDLIVSMTDLSKEGATLGKPAVVPNDGTFLHNQRIGKVEILDDSYLDKNYLKALLLTEEFHKQVLSTATGSTVRHTSPSRIYEFEFALPNLNHQRAIGEVLGALDDKIVANRAAISAGQKLIQTQWEQLSASADEVCDLNDVVDLNPRTPLPSEGPHPFLDMKELPQNGLLVDRWSERESRSGSKFRNGDTLLARITPCFENGKVGLVDFLPPEVAGLGSTEYIVLRPKNRVPQAVPYCIATSGSFRAHAARGMTGTSGRQRVQASNIGDYPVGWPGQAALDRFGGFTDALIRRLSAARNENTLLSRTRDELLPLLMDGRITVKDAERIAADVL